MSKKKGVPGYPAADLLLGDVVEIYTEQYVVFDFYTDRTYLHIVGDDTQKAIVGSNCAVRLIRKANGPTYATWQRRTSKILKAMGLSKWPGAVMHQYFFDSVSPEEAAAGFMADHFLID